MEVRSDVGDLAKRELSRSPVMAAHPDVERRVIQHSAPSRRGINDAGAVRQPRKPTKLVSILSHLARFATGTGYREYLVLENLASLKPNLLIVRRPSGRQVFIVRRQLGNHLVAGTLT